MGMPTFETDPEAREGATSQSVTLHPNLARLVAAYQQILGRLQRGEIDVTQANVEIRELVARDDDGVQWTINPRDGGWLYLSRRGTWEAGEPPRSGFATLTAHDLRAQAGQLPVAYNPDWDIDVTPAAANGVRGVLRSPAVRREQHAEARRGRWVVFAAAIAAVAAAMWVVTNGDGAPIAPGVTSTLPASTVPASLIP
jgi:hypothetical protein